MAAADGAGLDAGFFKFLGLEGVANKDVAGGAEEADDGVVLADGIGKCQEILSFKIVVFSGLRTSVIPASSHALI